MQRWLVLFKLADFHQSRFYKSSEQAVTSPERVGDIDWLLLALPRSPVLRYWEAWMAAENTASGDCLVSCSHKRQTQYTHKEDNRDPGGRFYCIFRVLFLERRATPRPVNVSQCRPVFIGVRTFCTRIKWITPIHFIVSPPFTTHPFLFPFHILLFSKKGLKRDK